MNASEILFTGRVSDSVKIAAPPFAVLATVNLVTLNNFLQTMVLLLTVASLLYRWRRPIMAEILRRRRLAEKQNNTREANTLASRKKPVTGNNNKNDDDPNI